MKKFLKFILYGFGILIALIIAVIILAIIFGSSDSTTQTPTAPEQIVVVQSLQLARDYDSNEIAADKAYKGKALEVTGRITSIDSDVSNDAVVSLNGTNGFNDVRAMGDSDFNDYAATLRKGETITLMCKGGGEMITSPILINCKPKQ